MYCAEIIPPPLSLRFSSDQSRINILVGFMVACILWKHNTEQYTRRECKLDYITKDRLHIGTG
jgi:hypothetical protein